jgi:iron complex outermembrane receptor protein
LTVNAAWDVLGQKLTYNFGRQFSRTGLYFNATDSLNIVPGFESGNTVNNRSLPKFSTHEIRLSSGSDSGLPFEYDLGWFSKDSGGTIDFVIPTFLPGAFGAPFQSIPGQVRSPRPGYVLNANFAFGLGQSFDSFYGNLKFKFGENTELSGGVAFVKDRVPVRTDLNTTAAIIALPVFLPPPSGCQGISQFLPVSADYGPGYCQSAIAAGVLPVEAFNPTYKKTLYNFSLSHKFTEDLLVYATTGSSFRTGLPALNNAGLPANLLLPEPEGAKSYELGIKASFGRQLRINAAVFQLDYQDQLTRFEGVSYLSSVPNQGLRTTGVAFYRNIDARVRGFELDVAAQPADGLTLGATLSYSQMKSKGGSVPCNNPAVPLSAANPINFCPSVAGEVLNTTAPFQATVNGGYEIPVSGSMDGYFRFNLSYQGNNPNYGNFRTGGAFKPTPAYAIVDLFAGLTGSEGAWDLGFYAKNVFNKQAELARVFTPNTIFPLFAAPSGYDVVRVSPPREIGVTLRYAFGSR